MANQNDYLPFAGDIGANIIAQSTYQALVARQSGFVAGVANSDEMNKLFRQVSVMAAGIAQAYVDTLNQDLLDDGNPDTIKNALLSLINNRVAAGGGGGGGGGGGFTTVRKTANYTAAAYEEVICDTTGGGFTLTLPGGTPALGAQVRAVGDFQTNNLTVAGNGHNILGAATYTLNLNNLGPTFIFDPTSNLWRIRQ